MLAGRVKDQFKMEPVFGEDLFFRLRLDTAAKASPLAIFYCLNAPLQSLIAKMYDHLATVQQQIKLRFASTKISTKHSVRFLRNPEPERALKNLSSSENHDHYDSNPAEDTDHDGNLLEKRAQYKESAVKFIKAENLS